VGDIHQPLHTESLDRGGNSIQVRFGRAHTNLHHVWDTNIPEKIVGGYKLEDAHQWAATLTKSIKSGVYRPLARGWLAGIELEDPVTTSLGWATESNAFVCTAVLPGGIEGVEDQDLSGEYYDAAVPVVQLQIAKGGYR
jgi:S1/P1 Nuclease